MSDVNDIKKRAKAAGIQAKELLAAKREVEAYHQQHQEFVDQVRKTAFEVFTGRHDRFWLIFGHYGDTQYGKMFHGGGDYNTVRNWDTCARSVWYACPGLCACEEDAPEALWEFLKNESFRIPCNADLYREALNRFDTSSVALQA